MRICQRCGRTWKDETAAKLDFRCTQPDDEGAACGGRLVSGTETPAGVSAHHAAHPEVEAHSSLIDLPLNSFPSVLAIPIAEYLAETHPVMRLHRMCDAVEILSRFMCIVSLAEVLRAAPGHSLDEELLEILQTRIERPTLGQWSHMLAELTRRWEACPDLAVPGGPALVTGRLLPLLGTGGGVNEVDLLTLRNNLAHGGAMTAEAARALLAAYERGPSDPGQPSNRRIPELWHAVGVLMSGQELVFVAHDGPFVLSGQRASQQESPARPRGALPEGSPLVNHVVLLSGTGVLDLWPLCGYGKAKSRSPRGERIARHETPLVYIRADRERLIYAALGSELPSAEDRDALAAFRKLFRLESRVVDHRQTQDFEEELRQEAASFLGRVEEVKTVKDAVKATSSGVLWVSGRGGIGKSMLMALLANHLGGQPKRMLRVFYRFKAADARCRRDGFLRLAVRSLAGWLTTPEREVTADSTGGIVELEKELDRLLDEVAKGSAVKETGGKPRRVLFVLDGLDEIVRSDPAFAELPFAKSRPHVVWLCAGRPEHGLSEVFRPDRCRHLFPVRDGLPDGGLPRMSRNDIRGMLIEELGSGKYALLKRDVEQKAGDGRLVVDNDFVEAVVERAEGLPIYVRFVTEDLLADELTVNDAHRLPPRLAAYYDELLRRLSIGDLQAVLTPLVVSVAWAHEPLPVETLHVILTRRTVVPSGASGLSLVERALARLQTMLRAVRGPAGGLEYEPYHPTFRQHVRESADVAAQGVLAREEFCRLAMDWQEVPVGPARLYSLRRGACHLVDSGRESDAAALLTDLAFVVAKCEGVGVDELLEDYRRVTESRPSAGKAGQVLEGLQRSLELVAHRLRATPNALFQEVYNQASWHDRPNGPLFSQLEEWRSSWEAAGRVWLCSLVAPRTPLRGALLRTLTGHTLDVWACAMSPDGRQIVSGSIDKTLRVWDVATGRELSVLESESVVTCCAVTPDGARVVSGSSWEVKTWDLRTGRELATLLGHSAGINCCAVTPDGAWAVSGSDDRSLKVWDLATGGELATLRGHSSGVSCCAVTPDGKRVVSGSYDKTLKVWDLAARREVATLVGHLDGVTACAVTPDGRQVVSGSVDKTLKVWDLTTRRELATLAGHSKTVVCCTVTPDGTRVVSGSHDSTLKVWDLTRCRELATLAGRTSYAKCCAVTPDGTHVVSGGGNTLKVWKLAPGLGLGLPIPAQHSDRVSCIVVTPDGSRVVSGSADKTLKVWDLKTGQELASLAGHSDWVNCCALTPDGTRLVSGSGDNALRVWDLMTGRELLTLLGHRWAVKCCVVTPDGRRAVSGSLGGTLKVWDLATGEELATLAGHSSHVQACAVTPDGMSVVSASEDKTLKVWDLATYHELATLAGHSDVVDVCVVTPDGTRVVSGSWDKTLKVWSLATGRELATLKGHSQMVSCCAVTPDGSRVVSGSTDSTLKVWELATGLELATLVGHSNCVRACAVTLDGSRLVSAAWDGCVRIWELRTFGCQALLQGEGLMTRCAATPDGRQIAVGLGDGGILFLQIRG